MIVGLEIPLPMGGGVCTTIVSGVYEYQLPTENTKYRLHDLRTTSRPLVPQVDCHSLRAGQASKLTLSRKVTFVPIGPSYRPWM